MNAIRSFETSENTRSLRMRHVTQNYNLPFPVYCKVPLRQPVTENRNVMTSHTLPSLRSSQFKPWLWHRTPFYDWNVDPLTPVPPDKCEVSKSNCKQVTTSSLQLHKYAQLNRILEACINLSLILGFKFQLMPKTKGFSIFRTSKFTHRRTVHHYMSVHDIETSEHGHDTRREYNPVHQVRNGNIIWNCILLPLALHLLNSSPLLHSSLDCINSPISALNRCDIFRLPLLLISTSSWFSRGLTSQVHFILSSSHVQPIQFNPVQQLSSHSLHNSEFFAPHPTPNRAKYFPQNVPLKGSKKALTMFTHRPSLEAICEHWT
jgi:hypothetical protein